MGGGTGGTCPPLNDSVTQTIPVADLGGGGRGGKCPPLNDRLSKRERILVKQLQNPAQSNQLWTRETVYGTWGGAEGASAPLNDTLSKREYWSNNSKIQPSQTNGGQGKLFTELIQEYVTTRNGQPNGSRRCELQVEHHRGPWAMALHLW
jgi:hypothetical protein